MSVDPKFIAESVERVLDAFGDVAGVVKACENQLWQKSHAPELTDATDKDLCDIARTLSLVARLINWKSMRQSASWSKRKPPKRNFGVQPAASRGGVSLFPPFTIDPRSAAQPSNARRFSDR